MNKSDKSYEAINSKSQAVNNAQRGIALLESLIALLIFSMGILAIVGLQGFMIKGTAESKARSDASFLAQNRVAMIWGADPVNLAAYAEVGTPVPELPNGSRDTVVNVVPDGANVTVTITWQQPGLNSVIHNYTTNARVMGAL
ncbi:MAG: prepilin-type cleavage/methylation domain-containing protein [Methylotenera sp.]